jgi:hypothetical protein
MGCRFLRVCVSVAGLSRENYRGLVLDGVNDSCGFVMDSVMGWGWRWSSVGVKEGWVDCVQSVFLLPSSFFLLPPSFLPLPSPFSSDRRRNSQTGVLAPAFGTRGPDHVRARARAKPWPDFLRAFPIPHSPFPIRHSPRDCGSRHDAIGDV